ncbi:hypothetical protein BCJMU51_2395 [Bacillus cereus]|nr:hypothetical protein [Bacillus cereus]BCC70705.1 hypothetical protein BCJMU51_2395 [Bacillus cereus]
MSFAAWSAIFTTLIGAISGAIFGTISFRNKSKIKYLHKNEFLIKLYTKK